MPVPMRGSRLRQAADRFKPLWRAARLPFGIADMFRSSTAPCSGLRFSTKKAATQEARAADRDGVGRTPGAPTRERWRAVSKKGTEIRSSRRSAREIGYVARGLGSAKAIEPRE